METEADNIQNFSRTQPAATRAGAQRGRRRKEIIIKQSRAEKAPASENDGVMLCLVCVFVCL